MSKVSRNVTFELVRPYLTKIVITQGLCLLLSALLLDGGTGLRLCFAAIFAHWIAIAFVSAREKKAASRVDELVLRWGFVPCLLCAIMFGQMIS